MNKKDAILINPARFLRVRARYRLSVEEVVDLVPCLFEYLLDGIEPSGKSPQFMEAFKYLCEDAEAVYTKEQSDGEV